MRLSHIFSVSILSPPAKLSLSDQTTFSILRCGLPYGAGAWSVTRLILHQKTSLGNEELMRAGEELTKVSIDFVFHIEQSDEAEAD